MMELNTKEIVFIVPLWIHVVEFIIDISYWIIVLLGLIRELIIFV